MITPEMLDGPEVPEIDLNEYGGVSGHFAYEVDKLFTKSVHYLTFLRDPTARTVSQYKQFRRIDLTSPYIQQSGNLTHYRDVQAMSLDDYVNDPFFQNDFQNLQTRMLGLLIDRPIKQLRDTRPLDRDEDRNYSLELAKERLRRFAYFGLQEYFRESLELFAFQFNCPPFPKIPEANVSPEQESISPQSIQKLQELNRLDVELYAFAKTLFDLRYREMKSDLEDRYQPTLLQMLQLNSLENNRIATFPFRFQFQGMYRITGWYPAEFSSGQQWCWSGPETVSTIELNLDRSEPLQIRFPMAVVLDSEIVRKLVVRVDNSSIELTHSNEDSVHYVKGTIPTAHRSLTSTRLSFHVDRTMYPFGTNSRLLGIALSWIDFTRV